MRAGWRSALVASMAHDDAGGEGDDVVSMFRFVASFLLVVAAACTAVVVTAKLVVSSHPPLTELAPTPIVQSTPVSATRLDDHHLRFVLRVENLGTQTGSARCGILATNAPGYNPLAPQSQLGVARYPWLSRGSTRAWLTTHYFGIVQFIPRALHPRRPKTLEELVTTIGMALPAHLTAQTACVWGSSTTGTASAA